MSCRDPTDLTSEVSELLGALRRPSAMVRSRVEQALDAKTKPPGSLGRLEELAARYAGIRHDELPEPPRFGIVVAAADHGVARRSVSAYPAEVTSQMIANIAAGGAAISVLAREVGARVLVVDAGSGSGEVAPGVIDVRRRRGSGDISREPAMSVEEALRLILVGADLADRLIADGCTAIALGEMGIGNSTVAAALTAALSGAEPGAVVGRGTGVDDDGLARKREAVTLALGRLEDATINDPLALLAEIGGLEIAVLVGVALRAGARRTAVLLDGYISTAAALVAVALVPDLRLCLIASHRSREPGHSIALQWLQADPLLDLQLRLGEGSGAALAMPLISAAVRILREMATFESAGVSTGS
jgi:nicotinate-nucleotide--dimethylbenzimidazole phosphoribosyltransferase